LQVKVIRVHWTTLGAYIALDTVLCFIPGPAVMAVVASALSRSRTGFATASGILTGNFIYFVVSALGIASVILASHAVFVIIKWCGAAFLAYLGIRALVASLSHAQDAMIPSDPHRLARGWASGTVTQLANPKALVFFVAILPQFVDPHANLVLQISILGVAGLLVELVVLSIYIALADRIRKGGIAPASRVWTERIGGALMLGVAAAVVRE
jgi:homoserine/homoserine lactone efflux protein